MQSQRLIQKKLANRDVFMSADRWQVYAGEDWLQKITAELKIAQAVVLLLSPQSVLRPWVNFEAGGASLAGTRSAEYATAACFQAPFRSPIRACRR